MLATGFIGMLLMAAFGVVLPTLHMSCEAVTNGIASPTAFDGTQSMLCRFGYGFGTPKQHN